VKLVLSMVAIAILPALAGCVSNPDVIRVYSGKEVEGAYITPEAYAHYTQGAIYEAEGNDHAAAEEYERAAEEDPDSPDIWTRLGATHCRLGSANAESFFARAEDEDINYAPLWRERARCALKKGDAKRAGEWARRAVSLDPDDEASSLAVAESEAKLRHKDSAARWLRALLARDPSSQPAKTALAAIDSSSLLKPASKPILKSDRPSFADVDRAIIETNASDVHRLAIRANVAPSTLAIRAAALGRFEIARRESERALAADPGDADAWVAALVAADALRDTDRFVTALRALGSAPLTPSPLGARLLVELIGRRVGKDAARAWLEGFGPLPEPADDLERRVMTRGEEP
jgi:tetratricopeptide (TPR) repeat protein